jgi:VIT1/CCC1 family predicted Fe2+/Mn2+ transporter
MTENSPNQSYRLEGIAFGLADGLIMCLGLIIGVAEVTFETRLVIITGIIGGFANAFGNSIGFFMSQSAERARARAGLWTMWNKTKQEVLSLQR